LRKQYPALREGEVAWLKNSASEEVLSIVRKDAKDEFLILINLSSRRVTGSVDDLAGAGDYQPVNIAGWSYPVDVHAPDFKLNGYGWMIWHRVVSK
jgi:glycosidase